jgi:enoyl-CoA hydratase/carnithine racemase
MGASYDTRGTVAVITLDNPPVNGLGYDTRVAFAAGLERAWGDPHIKAIVVTGAGKAFSGGADIREFGSPKATAEPWRRSTAYAWAAAWSFRSAATTGWPRPGCRLHCLK